MKHTSYLIISVVLCAALPGCGNRNKTVESATDSVQNEAPAITDVTLTDAQVQSLGVTTGSIPQHQFEGLIEANGTLAVMPQSEASVSPYIGANVKTILVKEGQSVRRGQPLARLSHPDLLDLQSRYLTAYNRLTYVKQEYERQRKLYTAQIGAGKDFQQIQSECRTLQAELRTTASQLSLLGINPAQTQRGKITTTIAVVSPISGTVEQISVKTGQYADAQTPMFHIVNTDHVYADLLVFEKDAPLVRTGQHVTLSLKSASGAQYTGTVLSVGKTFEQSPKVVHVRTSIDGSRKGLITGMYLCGQIASDTKHLPALPEEGIVDDGGKSYLFTVKRQKNKWTFHPVEIKKGREEGGFIEILGCPLNSSTVVALNNAYYLLSEMKKGETGEE